MTNEAQEASIRRHIAKLRKGVLVFFCRPGTSGSECVVARSASQARAVVRSMSETDTVSVRLAYDFEVTQPDQEQTATYLSCFEKAAEIDRWWDNVCYAIDDLKIDGLALSDIDQRLRPSGSPYGDRSNCPVRWKRIGWEPIYTTDDKDTGSFVMTRFDWSRPRYYLVGTGLLDEFQAATGNDYRGILGRQVHFGLDICALAPSGFDGKMCLTDILDWASRGSLTPREPLAYVRVVENTDLSTACQEISLDADKTRRENERARRQARELEQAQVRLRSASETVDKALRLDGRLIQQVDVGLAAGTLPATEKGRD